MPSVDLEKLPPDAATLVRDLAGASAKAFPIGSTKWLVSELGDFGIGLGWGFRIQPADSKSVYKLVRMFDSKTAGLFEGREMDAFSPGFLGRRSNWCLFEWKEGTHPTPSTHAREVVEQLPPMMASISKLGGASWCAAERLRNAVSEIQACSFVSADGISEAVEELGCLYILASAQVAWSIEDLRLENFLFSSDGDLMAVDQNAVVCRPVGFDLARLVVYDSMGLGREDSKTVLRTFSSQVRQPIDFEYLRACAVGFCLLHASKFIQLHDRTHGRSRQIQEFCRYQTAKSIRRLKKVYTRW